MEHLPGMELSCVNEEERMVDCRKSTDIGNGLTAQAVPFQIVGHRIDVVSSTWERARV